MNLTRVILCCAACSVAARSATTIDPIHQFGWSGNLGWTSWQDAIIGEYVCSGHVWIANCGWVHLGDGSPADGIRYANTGPSDYGVNLRNPSPGGGALKAELRGFAYAANLGWLHFEAAGNPEISLETGRLSGSVWSANCGWIQLDGASWFIRSNTLQPGTDSDADGIADAYELEHTFPQNLTTLTAAGDADGDGKTDLDEYLADTDPGNARSSLAITGFAVTGDSCVLTWNSSLSRIYRISSSLSMRPESWEPVLENIVPEGDFTSRAIPAVVAEKRFFRVETQPPLRP